MDKTSAAKLVDIFIWSLFKLNQSPESMFKDPPPFSGTQGETFAGNMKYYLLESMAVLETYKQHQTLDRTIAEHSTGFDSEVIAATDPAIAKRAQGLIDAKRALMMAISRHILQHEKIEPPKTTPLEQAVERGFTKETAS